MRMICVLSWLKIPAGGIAAALSALTLAAQEPLQFNVPYHCPDGTDNIITKCVTNARGGEVCYWRQEKNGQLEVERFNVRGQMDGWLKICKVQNAQAGKPGAAADKPNQPGTAPSQPGQPLNPPYLSEMPAVEKVKREIQGANPDDTLARQVAVFTYLPVIIERRQDPGRSVRAGFTPDEQRVVQAYRVAGYELSQTFAKTHTPEQLKAFEQAHGRYEMDSEFYKQWFNGLFSPAFRAGYQNAQSANAAHAKAHFDAERREHDNATAQQKAAAQAASAANSAEVQPGTKQALARCIASGRSQRVCFSENMSSGFDQLTGISLHLPSTPGLRMTGDYSGATGVRIVFQPEKAVISCRGVPSPLPYTVEMSDTQTLVKIQHGARPVVLALRQDGKLEGSGPIRLTGPVAAGTGTEQTMGTTSTTTTTQRELTPLEAQNYPDAKQNGQVFVNTETSTETGYGPTGTRTVTRYVNKTADCNLGLMTATGPTPLPPDVESPFGLLTTIASGMGALMESGSIDKAANQMLNLDKAPAPGLRMTGKYAGQGGFSVIFHPESVTVACGAAELAHEYAMHKNGREILLKVQDKENPITFLVKPDGSLFAEGAVQVNGRVIVGSTEDPKNPFVYAPKIGRCQMGTLTASR